MTNKKLKMAAMSVALTACVAASPLAANADAPEAAPVELEKEPVAEETKKEENTAEPQDNKQSEKAQETLKDAEVKYDKENPKPTPDGSEKLKGVIVTNPEGSGETAPDPNPNPDSGETNPNPNPNPDSGETDPNPNPNPNPGSGETNPNPNPGSGETAPEEKKSEEKKPEEKEPEEKKPEQIGTAEKTEKSETNVETKPNPGAEPIVDTTTPPTVEKNPDGSTTITQPTVTPGKETTTTTGTGEAKGDLKEKVEEVKEINLDKELGENPNISWDIKEGDEAVNDYKVEEVTNDGNQQTLKLKKVEETNAEMTAEDIAKLVDAEKPTVNPDGTYTLTRTETILDAEGNPQTRTTYITIQDNKVTTKTTTELTITRKKEERDGGESFRDEVTYPSIQIKDGDKVVETIQPEDLEKMLNKGTAADDGIHFTKDGKEYVIQETTQPGETKLSNAEIVDRLKKDGNKNYELGADGEIYYTTPHKEKVKLDVTQNELLRRSLTYKVTLKTTEKGEKGTAGEQTATENAKRDAIRDALTKAVDKLGIEDTATASQLKAKISGLTITQEQLDKGGTFEVTLEDGTKYTLTCSAAEVTVTPGTPTTEKPDISNPENVKDVKDHTVTGTAYVTGSTIIWKGEDQNYDTGAGTLGIGADFKTAPEGATAVERDGLDRITSYKDAQGNTHSFKYKDGVDLNDLTPEEKTALEAAANKPGWTTENLTASLTRVRWEVVSPERKEPKTENIVGASPIELVKDNNNWSQTDNNGTFDFTHSGTTYTGMTLESTSEDGKTKTYKKTDTDGTVTIITVTTQQLGEEEIKAKFDARFGKYTRDAKAKTVTYTGEDGKTYTASYVAQEEKLTVEVQKPDVVAATGSTETEAQNAFLDNLEKARLEAMAKGETLVIEYEENGEIKNLKVDRKMTWDEVVVVVGHVVNYNAMTDAELVTYLKELETTAKNTGKYYDGSASYWGTTPYYRDAAGKMQRVPKGATIYKKYGISYVKIDGKEYVVHKDNNYIAHLDLATDSNLTLSEKEKDGTAKTDNCVLLNPTLTWHESAETLVKGSDKQAKFVDRITYDDEGDNNSKTGHYEYPRASWDDKKGHGKPTDNNAPTKSVFYKVTGQVAYGKLGNKYEATPTGGLFGNKYTDEDYAAAKKRAEDALAAYQAAHPELKDAQVVEIYTDQTKGGGHRYYQIYLYQSDLTAYGYMSDDNNTCGNALFNADGQSYYVGGYDLTLGDLTQTDEKHVVAKGKNTLALSATFKRRKLEERLNKELNYTPISKEWTEITPSEELRHGEDLSGEYRANYTKTADYTVGQQKGIEGTGEDTYKSFTNLIRNIFNGDGKGTEDGGFIKYVYHSEKNSDGTPVKFEADKMVVTTKQDAEVHYTFTSQESRDVWIKGYTQTVVPPVNPGPDSPELPPVEDAKPAPAPEAPVLPVVQDARPDPAPAPAPAPETPVLPAVQDARLIQTGTSGWLADLMLGAGMVLSAAGYWMERKRKAMFYKSQH